jgi:PAS domain S-box-containing protein
MPGGILAGRTSDTGLGPRLMRARLLGLLIRPAPPSLALGIAVGTSFIVVETVVVCLLNVFTGLSGTFDTFYLVGVLVVSTVWGFGLSAVVSVASAIAFAYFRDWPDGHFAPFEPENALVIAVFLLLALVANTLAGLARVGERFFTLSSDLLCITGPERVIRANPAFEVTLGYSSKDLESRPFLDLVVPDDRDRVRAVLQQLVDGDKTVRFEDRVMCSDGSQRWIDWSIVPRQGLFYAVGRDVTERRREQDELRQAQRMVEASRDELAVLVDQQTALRRVATLVARGVTPSEVFRAVADGMARCLHVRHATVSKFDAGVALVPLAIYHGDRIQTLPENFRLPLDGDNVAAKVLHTARAARMDSHGDAPGTHAARIRELGIRSAVGVPIIVDGLVWGAAIVGTKRSEPLPSDTEERVGDFADLVATAIANAATRAELIASRARIVAAADDARRRLERDLHDGAQQRLVTLGLQARLAEASVPPGLDDLKGQLSGIVSGLVGASADLQEISRGIHPAILSSGGLVSALKTLARRCTVPVTLELAIDRRLPDPVEVGVYYIVAEALTNTAKHAYASEVAVCAESTVDRLDLSIRDDGIGGADFAEGSGLIGLKDRVAALGGELSITSPAGTGTAVVVTIPLDASERIT